LRTKSAGSKRGVGIGARVCAASPTARAAVGTTGATCARLFTGATLTPPGEDARALSSTKDGTLAIGANAGAVDLTESDFDAQVFESGKVRNMHIF